MLFFKNAFFGGNVDWYPVCRSFLDNFGEGDWSEISYTTRGACWAVNENVSLNAVLEIKSDVLAMLLAFIRGKYILAGQ